MSWPTSWANCRFSPCLTARKSLMIPSLAMRTRMVKTMSCGLKKSTAGTICSRMVMPWTSTKPCRLQPQRRRPFQLDCHHTTSSSNGWLPTIQPNGIAHTSSATISTSRVASHAGRRIRYVPYLKSHLQKCIRRRLVDQSVSTALALINVNYNEFIRRIPIIAVEDARVFGAAYPVLVWLMLAASKGYTPLPQSLVPDVLGAVAQIAASNVQDKGWMHCPKGQRGNEVTVVLNSIEVAEGLPRWARDILWSIRCRREFGGMAGDIKMLDQSLICLFHRFSTCPDRSVLESQFLAPVPILPAQAIPGPIQPNRFLLNAIDFHVSPIIAHLAARYPQFSEDLLKATIWECSSGVNRRSAATNWDPVKAKAGDPSQGWEWDTPREYAPSTELVHVWRAIEGDL
ncbi:hypothetical protein BCR44DRAFT_1264598 [Catenaria anguillulae PL171]|uniref:Uncharacterized protein n=1 Tax=Catenaria anguillulae PL171 TaxID=765915 RepID=A0A1Y2HAE2_9FUNG|nr:hypothetical protein BCR44DRAFT_1264598 [Catenaria anguillulae PL171]